MKNTPIYELYNQGLLGWNRDLSRENFQLYESSIPRYCDYVPVIEPIGKRRMLWEYTRAVLGKDTENYPQQIGDCHIADTQVLMGDGKTKNIQDIQVGDYVFTHKNNMRKVTNTIAKKFTGSLITFQAKDHPYKITSTDTHLFPIFNDLNQEQIVWTKALNLNTVRCAILVNDFNFADHDFLVKAGKFRLIDTITSEHVKNHNVYCIEVEEDHSFIANGYMSHNCVSFGHYKNPLEYLQCVEIALNKDAEKFKKIFPPYGYGCGRVFIGKGRLGRSDGSVGDWAQQANKLYGVLSSEDDGVPSYSGSVAKEWGYKGPPKEFVEIGKAHLIKTTALIRNTQELADALWKGYPVGIASNQGFAMEASSDGFHRPRGNWGHCFPGNSIILSDKPTFANNIKIGDRLFTRKGFDTVVDVSKRKYTGDLIVIKAVGIPKFKLTPEHPVLIYRPVPSYYRIKPGTVLEEFSSGSFLYLKEKYEDHNSKQPIWVKAEDLLPTDYVLMSLLQEKEIVIPNWDYCNKAKHTPSKLIYNSDIGWLFGLYLGDGNAEPNHRICITLNKSEEDLAIRAKNIMEDLFKIPVRISYKNTYIRVICDSATVANTFAKWFGKDCYDKHIPDWLYCSNAIDVINGLQDADGGIQNSLNYINGVSEALMWQSYHILASNNKYPCIDDINGESAGFDNAKDGFRVEWRMPITNKVSGSYWEEFYCKPILAIYTEEFDDYVYDFKMENEHNFIMGGSLVHNSMCCIGFENHDKYGLYFIILNSWGDVHGHLKDFSSDSDLPIGVLRAKADVVDHMLSENDSFAFSQFQGYPDNSPQLNRLDFKLVGKE